MKASDRILHWIPRIICMIAILFISKFAMDAMESYLTIWQQILLVMVHLIPALLLVGLLIIAWKWELLGGILFTLIGLALAPIIYQHNYNMDQSMGMSLGFVMIFALPLIIIGSLFILSFIKRRKYRMMNPKRVINHLPLDN